LLTLALGSCTSMSPGDPSATTAPPQRSSRPITQPNNSLELLSQSQTQYAEVGKTYRPPSTIIPGTGNFINERAASRTVPLAPGKGEVTLNFEAADLREVVKVVFDTLQENYIIDPGVQGLVTIQTSRPIGKEQLLPTLESLLAMNGAALIREGGVYKVVPFSGAAPAGVSSRKQVRAGPGYSVRVVPLRYISATEMEKILTPFLPDGGILNVDPLRNVLTLGGTSQELARAQQTIGIFDVNWIQGMSVGIFRLENVESQVIAEELNNIFGEGSSMAVGGLLRFIPIAQLNAVLVITPQVEYLREAGRWIERLDGIGGERLYVYEVQNGDAGYLASILSELFGGGGGGGGVSGQVAPGLAPISLESGETGDGQGIEGGAPAAGGGLPTASAPASISTATLGFGGSEVRVIADVENNSLVIWASNRDYEKILGALQKLDVTPRQVLVEATIAEVTLTDDFRFGLRWWFVNNTGEYRGIASQGLRTNVTLDDLNNADAGASVLDQGFNYVLTDPSGLVRGLLSTLASESKLKVLQAPSVMVVDNQEANIRVGEQVQVPTQSQVTGTGIATQSFEFKDTGVLLQVRPQVNAGGLVSMDINQEVTNIGPTDPTTGRLTFFQRSIKSRVAVQSGETIVLGGLIDDSISKSRSGIPVLYKLPLIGPLFGQINDNKERTELIIVLTPRVIEDGQDMNEAIDILRRRMRQAAPVIEATLG
jgi:general secretion pathway protein D